MDSTFTCSPPTSRASDARSSVLAMTFNVLAAAFETASPATSSAAKATAAPRSNHKCFALMDAPLVTRRFFCKNRCTYCDRLSKRLLKNPVLLVARRTGIPACLLFAATYRRATGKNACPTWVFQQPLRVGEDFRPA